jgi:hypothetical protein
MAMAGFLYAGRMVLVVLVIAGGVWDCEELVVLAVLCDCVVTDVGICVPTSDWATVAGLETGTDLVAAVPSQYQSFRLK